MDQNRGETTTEGFKQCKTCHVVKPTSEFWKNKASKDGFCSSCRSCETKRSINRRTDPAKRKDRVHIYHGKDDTAKLRVAYAEAQKEGQPCACCGNYYHPKCYDWHHLDDSQKRFQISQIRSLGGHINMNDVKAELDKCILLCNGCHRLVHLGLVTLLTRQK